MTDKLSLKLSVPLEDTKAQESYYSIYESNRGRYLTLSAGASIVLQYKTEAPYDPGQVVKITEDNIYQVSKFFRIFYERVLLRKNLFQYYTSGNITCDLRKTDIMTHSLRTGGHIKLEPTVIVNLNDVCLPGVNLYINMDEQKADLSVDEFETLMNRLSTINISEEAMQLIITRLLLDTKLDRSTYTSSTDTTKSKPSNPVNIFQRKEKPSLSETHEEVVDYRPKVNQPKSLDELP